VSTSGPSATVLAGAHAHGPGAAPGPGAPSSNPPGVHSGRIDAPLHQPGWDKALGERVLWLVGQKFHGAELRLNPSHLGPIQVKINVHNDQATVAFSAQHAVTREHLEAALPRLREMLGGQGLSLVNVNVSQHSFGERREPPATAFGQVGAGPVERGADDSVVEIPTVVRQLALGTIDYFA